MYEIKVSAASLIGARHINQDNVLLDDFLAPQKLESVMCFDPIWMKVRKSKTFAVADGMGGSFSGETAALTAVKTLYKKRNKRVFKPAFWDKINRNVIKESASGTTLAVCNITENSEKLKADFYSIGDSLIYLYQASTKKLIKMNIGDNKADRAKGKLSKDELRKARSVLCDFLGKEYPQNEVPIHESLAFLKKNDKIVIASDGIAHLSEKEILSVLRKKQNKYNTAKAIAELAVETSDEYCDNTTVIVAEIIK